MCIVSCILGYKYEHKNTLLVQKDLDSANIDIHNRDAIIEKLEDSVKEAQKQEEAARLREKEASKELDDFKKAKSEEIANLKKDSIQLVNKSECAVLKEHLCPAAMDY